MIARWRRIRSEFGTRVYAKTVFLAAGLVVLAVFGWVAFRSLLATWVALGGLVLGLVLQRLFVAAIEIYPTLSRVSLFVYGVVLFVGHRFGLDRDLELAIITGTTVLLFDFQFWGYSDPQVVNDSAGET